MFSKEDQIRADNWDNTVCLGRGITNPNTLLSKEYQLLSSEEKDNYQYRVGLSIIRFKALYYLFDGSTASDLEYDFLERLYEAVCQDINIVPAITDMVGFNMNYQECEDVYNQLLKEGHKPKHETT